MKSVIVETFGCKRDDVFTLYPISDAHVGGAACDEEALRGTVAEIAADRRYRRWVDVGDSIEAIRPSDKRFDPCQLAPWLDVSDLANLGYAQADRYADIVEPIASQLWGKAMGNHERTVIARDGFNPHYHVLSRLARTAQKPIPRLDLDYIGHVLLKFYRSGEETPERCETVSMLVWHGAGGGASFPATKLYNLLGGFDVDLLLTGHVHKTGYVERDVMTWNRTTGRQGLSRRTAVVCGTYARSYNPNGSPTYGEIAGYMPAAVSGVTVELAPFARDKTARVRVLGTQRVGREFAE